jgi:hypothetical protein
MRVVKMGWVKKNLFQTYPINQQYEVFFLSVGNKKAHLFDFFKIEIRDIQFAPRFFKLVPDTTV